MAKNDLIGGSLWDEYSNKVQELMNNPKNQGEITPEEAENRGHKLIVADYGAESCGDAVRLYWEIDPETDKIVDAKFKSFGCGTAIASSDMMVELCKGKTVDEAVKITNLDVEKALRDEPDTPAVPPQKMHCSVMAYDVIKKAAGLYKGVDAESFAKYAEKEIEYYKRIYPEIDSRVEVRDDIVAGAMVSGGDFLISKSARFPKNRVEALLNHEIGTHILTYINGTAQPLMQLHTGLSGYDEMQEGIAVLSEYLCGGISRARLRVLAARVVAVDMLCAGACFPEVFSALSQKYGFGERSAFTITTRVFRGGGLTKDAVYLRGLVGIIDYLHGDGPIEPLFIGKIAAEHIPLVEELQWRGILKPPPLWPRWLERDDAKARLREIREKRLGLIDLIEKGYI